MTYCMILWSPFPCLVSYLYWLVASEKHQGLWNYGDTSVSHRIHNQVFRNTPHWRFPLVFFLQVRIAHIKLTNWWHALWHTYTYISNQHDLFLVHSGKGAFAACFRCWCRWSLAGTWSSAFCTTMTLMVRKAGSGRSLSDWAKMGLACPTSLSAKYPTRKGQPDWLWTTWSNFLLALAFQNLVGSSFLVPRSWGSNGMQWFDVSYVFQTLEPGLQKKNAYFQRTKVCPQMSPEFACKSADSGDELQMTFVQSLKMVSGMGVGVTKCRATGGQ